MNKTLAILAIAAVLVTPFIGLYLNHRFTRPGAIDTTTPYQLANNIEVTFPLSDIEVHTILDGGSRAVTFLDAHQKEFGLQITYDATTDSMTDRTFFIPIQGQEPWQPTQTSPEIIDPLFYHCLQHSNQPDSGHIANTIWPSWWVKIQPPYDIWIMP